MADFERARPKQFLKFFADRSLFQATLTRVAAEGMDDVVVVTRQPHAALVKGQIAELGSGHSHLLLEPCRRDSAAIAAGVWWVKQNVGPNAIVAVLPAYHFVPDPAAFVRRRRRKGGLAGDVRHQAGHSRDGIRLHPAPRAAERP